MKTELKFNNQNFFPSLGPLANPECFHEPIQLNSHSIQTLIGFLKSMITIRCAEEKIAEQVVANNIKCPCHLAIGQEAIPTALSAHLMLGDKVFGAHRSHGHFLGLGGEVYKLFAEVLGKEDGCSHGMGGSMHLIDTKHHLYGTVPIVGATIPIATGAALASKLDKQGKIAVSFFGDGAAEEGVLHESLNLASKSKLPILYICENNLFSSHLHINERQPADSIARFAHSHFIQNIVIDGNDVVAMHEALQQAVEICRSGSGPVFIEAVTYRWRGHVGASEDLDVGVNRKDNIADWRKRDPISRLSDALIGRKGIDIADLNNIWLTTRNACEKYWTLALNSSYPGIEQLTERVYKNT
jgi:TPP-dependent pyruvate/acetoin dehydrogenase alpha subunit